jgi:hypothetical protein
MWPFTKKISNLELHEAFRQLKADFTALEFEWQQVRHSLKKLTGRLAKSEALEQSKAGATTEGTDLPPNGTGALPQAGLSDHQKAVQQQILRQRSRL